MASQSEFSNRVFWQRPSMIEVPSTKERVLHLKLWVSLWGNWLNLIRQINQPSCIHFQLLFDCNQLQSHKRDRTADVYSNQQDARMHSELDDLIKSRNKEKQTKKQKSSLLFCCLLLLLFVPRYRKHSANDRNADPRELVSIQSFSFRLPPNRRVVALKCGSALECGPPIEICEWKVSIARKRLLFNQNNLIIFVYRQATAGQGAEGATQAD